ncbi:FdtA/QdtA family cupin domain-containing protein [Akkermansiaceae bacterium]|nr:FdtA/QdtA family cupin domain-containing protein [Akkermansiaceae bacterium]
MFKIPEFIDSRGGLSVVEVGKQVPFEIKRVFFVHNVPESEVRGSHAHKECHQYLICSGGTVSVTVDDGESRKTLELEGSGQGLHLPPGIWGEQFNYSKNAVLSVFSSHPYDKGDYLNDYDDFKNWLSQRKDG